MKNKMSKLVMITLSILLSITSSFAQAPATLEWTLDGSNQTTVGPSVNPIVVTFLKDAANAPSSTVFSSFTPTLTATVSLRNQQRSSTLTGTSTVLPGITFGSYSTSSNGGATGIQTVGSLEVYNVFGANIPVQLPKNTMYISSPSETPVPATDAQGFGIGANPVGAGFDAESITGATGPNGGDTNFGIAVYSSVDPLFKANEAKDGRFYYGDMVITFNRPVKNPVLHLGGLGGSYNYQPLGAGPRQITYFSTELELQNTGLSSVFMAGNPNLNLVGNNILNSSAKPNAGSYDNGFTDNGYPLYGAASGSVKVVGTVQELVYRVYVRGSAASDFNYSKAQADINPSSRDPLNGDFWYMSVSLEKPTQEISGKVFIDADALQDNNINKTAGVDNPTTNVGELLWALLLNPAGKVVDQTPISSDGTYLFSNVPLLATGNYTVQLRDADFVGIPPVIGASYANPQNAPAPRLPAGWVNTGEFVSDPSIPGNTGVGNDGFVNGKIVVPVLGSDEAKVLNNFGIERTPESVDFTRLIKIPANNSILTLSPLSTDSAGLALPVLTGSDPEDMPTIGTLSNKKVKITSLLFSTGANATLLYGGVPVVLNQIISNYDPSLLQIRFNSVTFAPMVFEGMTSFTYAYIDIADKQDPTPATYTLVWQKPVPVLLQDFTATKSNCVATLNWKTTAEINSDKFEIEMATLTNPRFVKVGTVPAKGNTSSVSNYQLMFPMESGVVYQFRLKMLSTDGTNPQYSDIRTVSCIEKQQITIKPNPSIDIFKITGMEKGKNVISVLAADSKLIQQYEFFTTNADLNLAHLPKGVYILKIQNENGSVEVKRVVRN